MPRSIRVLVIEDEIMERGPLKAALELALSRPPNGATVAGEVRAPESVDLRAAVDHLIPRFRLAVENGDVASLPDLVVLDWKLPGDEHPDYPNVRSGMDIYLQLVPLLLGQPAIRTRFVIVTGYMEGVDDPSTHLGDEYERHLEVAFEGGLFDFWRKPFSEEAICSYLESMFELPSRWQTCEAIKRWRAQIRNAEGSLRDRIRQKIGSLAKPPRPKGKTIATLEYIEWTEKLSLWHQEVRALEHQDSVI